MKEIKGKYGKLIFCDCMDKDHGLPSLNPGDYEIVWSDIVWGHDYQNRAQKPMGINQKANKQDRLPYDDTWRPDFQRKWFECAKEKTVAQILCVGRMNKNWWVSNFNPIDWLMVYYKNGQGSTQISRYSAKMEYFCFGDVDYFKSHKFHRDAYETYISNGFLNNSKIETHPSPKDFKTWVEMIGDLKPASICDPFAGSCATGEVCEALGIHWIGFEIEERYYKDAEYRINQGISYNKLTNCRGLGNL